MTDRPGSEDRVVHILEEMRDLHRSHLEHYKEGLRNQAEAIQMQRDAQAMAERRLRMIPGLIVFVLVLVVVVLVLMMRTLT